MAESLSCAVCGNASPEFVCAGCNVQRYCSDACYRIGWNSGDHAPSCQSQQQKQMLTGAPPEDRRRDKPEEESCGDVDPEEGEGEPPLKRRRTGFETDDAGLTADAEEKEPVAESHVLQQLAERRGDTDIGKNLLLQLEPSEVSRLCRTSSFYQEICDTDTFQQLYRNEWFVDVAVLDLMGSRHDYSLIRTRLAGQVKMVYERDTGMDRSSYNMFFGGHYFTAQSVLAGMITPVPEGTSAKLVFHVSLRLGGPQGVRVMRHWFANGTTLDVSQ